MAHRSTSRALAVLAFLSILASAGSLQRAAANPEPEPPPPSTPESGKDTLPFEEDAKAVARFVEGAGALGQYYDEATATYRIRKPATGTGSDLNGRSTSELGILDIPVLVESSRTSHDELAAVMSAIKTHSKNAGGYAYGFFYRPKDDVVVLSTNAPRSSIATLLDRFPVVRYEWGKAGRTSRQYDTPPHWGAASITNDVGICSSGFSVVTSTGVRRMTTAGHCWHHYTAGGPEFHSRGGGGTFGTIGTAPYPSRDLGFLSGSTYGAYIYM